MESRSPTQQIVFLAEGLYSSYSETRLRVRIMHLTGLQQLFSSSTVERLIEASYLALSWKENGISSDISGSVIFQ